MSDSELPTKKDGSLDMRYKAAREAEGQETGPGSGGGAGRNQGSNGSGDGSSSSTTNNAGQDGRETNEDGVPLTKSGEPDKRYSSEHGFGGDRERASEEGKKGGRQGDNSDE